MRRGEGDGASGGGVPGPVDGTALDGGLGAFRPGPQPCLGGRPGGPLDGLVFAAKDLFDVAGFVTGAGNPDWARTHPPAIRTARAVEVLVRAGASLVGKTATDELAFSLNGENAHYGTPRNPRAPGRVPGGSSSGSAVAVAGGRVDFALGTDTAGSVRIPASYCGVFGFRPSQDAVSLAGVVPLAPMFDTVGWFARDAALLRRVGAALLPAAPTTPVATMPATSVTTMILAADAFALAGTEAAEALAPALTAARVCFAAEGAIDLALEGLERWAGVFRTLQARDVWRSHGGWIGAARPRFGPGIGERFAWTATVTAEAEAEARGRRAEIVARLRAVVAPGSVLVLPTAPGPAPHCGMPAAALEPFRARVFALTAIAGLGGLPQVTLPLARMDGCPLGLSLIGAADEDRALLAAAERLSTVWGGGH